MKDPTASITGQITLDGRPAAGLKVALCPQRHFSRENDIATGKTDSTGRYLFSSCLPMGRYWLEVGAPGYFDPFHWNEEGPGRGVSVADGEFVVNADLDLVLGGVITGRVIDPDGQPVVGEFVEVTKIGQLGPPDEPLDLPGEEGDFFTDGNGEYRIYGIPPGRYHVSTGINVAKVIGVTNRYPFFHSSGRVDGDHYFEKMFHPGTSNRSHAAIVDVSTGGIVRNANINVGRAIRAYTASGRVIHDETRIPIRHCYLLLGYYSPTGGRSWSYCMDEESDTDENGNFRVEGFLPGRFFISALFAGETELYCTPVGFEIKSEDLDGLEVKAHWGSELTGLVVIEGTNSQEALKRLAQLKLQADTQVEDAHDSRSCTVNSDGRFTIRGLRPGPVQLSLDFEKTSKYFSIVRIEYPDDAGRIVSILPASTTCSRELRFFGPRATADLPPPPPSAPTLSPELHPLPPAPLPAHDLLPLPPSAPTLSRGPAPPKQLPPSQRTITQGLRPVGSHLSPPPPTVSRSSPPLNVLAQAAPVGAPSESLWPLFPGDLPPLLLSEHGLSGVRMVLSYRNGSIRGHVTFKQKNLNFDRQLKAGISHRSERGGWSTSTEIDPNGDFFFDGLAPGEYEISILSETKTVLVDNDSE
ncbi:MAG TPA: hypothetical protein VKN18_12565, partial [Blastocatellia bacterium]|nr:hypothetical protein [Blastocatellia bacterium]